MTFSEYLLDYITRNQIKWLTASKLCNVDRQQLKRYTKGFAPRNIQTVVDIADGLGMTAKEKDELCRLYQRHKMGEKKYLLEMYIHQLFWQLPEENRDVEQPKGCLEDWSIEQVRIIEDPEQLYQLLGYLVHGVKNIRIKMNWAGKDQRLSRIVNSADKTTDIQQIVEIGARVAENKVREMQELEVLIPLFQKMDRYRVYCHYQWGQTKIEDFDRLNFILSDKGMVLFDDKMRVAVYANMKGYTEYYRVLFGRELSETNIFGGSIIGMPEIVHKDTLQYLENRESNIIFTYQKIPKEIIWIQKTGAVQKQIYVEEMNLVQMFKEYMRKQNNCV